MRVVIAGCGRVGRDVAEILTTYGDDVSVIDDSQAALDDLLGRVFDGTVHLGSAFDVAVLREAGVQEADAFLAVTDSDNVNLMAVQVAQEVFGVPKAIARLDDPAREQAYRALDVSYVPGPKLVSQVVVERIHEPDFAYHLTFPSGDVQVVEMVLGEGAAGLTVDGFEVDGRLRVAAVQRAGRVTIPSGEDRLEPGDLVVAAVKRGMSGRIRSLLAEDGGGR